MASSRGRPEVMRLTYRREVGLQDAEFRSLLEDARPGLCVEFAGAGLQFERIGAVDAVQRAAMG